MARSLPERRSKIALKRAADGGSLRTVWIALASNIVVAIAKIAAGLFTGSAAMLAVTAVGLAFTLAGFLIGRSLPPKALSEIQKLMEASPVIESVVGLHGVYIGPGEAIVVAKITPACTTVTEFAAGMDALDHRIRDAVPLVADVFVDVTARLPNASP